MMYSFHAKERVNLHLQYKIKLISQMLSRINVMILIVSQDVALPGAKINMFIR